MCIYVSHESIYIFGIFKANKCANAKETKKGSLDCEAGTAGALFFSFSFLRYVNLFRPKSCTHIP